VKPTRERKKVGYLEWRMEKEMAIENAARSVSLKVPNQKKLLRNARV
jgi:hypothetical protein